MEGGGWRRGGGVLRRGSGRVGEVLGSEGGRMEEVGE